MAHVCRFWGEKSRLLTGLVALAVAGAVSVASAAEDWPQSRHDAALSGRSSEAGVVDPAAQWIADLGFALAGEPAVVGCQLYVTLGSVVMALNAHDGTTLWTSSRGWAVPPTTVPSRLAVSAGGLVYAGEPGDPAILRLGKARHDLRIALDSYMVDNGTYPAGPDLEPELVPTFIASMPWNPIQGRKVQLAATASPGDYNYVRDPTDPYKYTLALWWVDGKYLVAEASDCGQPSGWPESPEQGGRAWALDATLGFEKWIDIARYPAETTVPTLAPGGAVWASGEVSCRNLANARLGRIRTIAADGTSGWETRAWAPYRGDAAREATTGRLFAARGPTAIAAYLNATVRTLAAAIESYQVDNGFPPAQGELAPYLVPAFVR